MVQLVHLKAQESYIHPNFKIRLGHVSRPGSFSCRVLGNCRSNEIFAPPQIASLHKTRTESYTFHAESPLSSTRTTKRYSWSFEICTFLQLLTEVFICVPRLCNNLYIQGEPLTTNSSLLKS